MKHFGVLKWEEGDKQTKTEHLLRCKYTADTNFCKEESIS